jgi:hypothetical protein
MSWRRPAAIVNDRPILSSERMLYKDYDRRCSIDKKNSGRESQGALRQDALTLTLSVEAGSNTSTVVLRVVGGDEKGTQCLGV